MMLAAVWMDLSARLHIDPKQSEIIWREIENAHGQPHRHYHTLTHIEAVVDHWQTLQSQFIAPDAALLALFFHDVVYDAAKSDNEERSAGMMRALLSASVDDKTLTRAAFSILETKHHQATGDADTDLVLDIDMAILGAPRDAYLRYAENVAREYLPVYGFDAYAAGRQALFLEPTLAHNRLFLTDAFANHEARARENLSAERDLWRSGIFAERLKSAL